MKKLMIMTKDLQSLGDAAKNIGIDRKTLYRWINAGKLVSVMVGPHRFIPTSEVKRLKR